MKKLSVLVMLFFITILTIQYGCKKDEPSVTNSNSPTTISSMAKKARGDVANTWMKMQLHMMATATGIPNVAFCRPYAYSSIALYESVVQGMNHYSSLAGQLNSMPAMPLRVPHLKYKWEASANAAMAAILKSMYPTTSAANLFSIDSLENVFNQIYNQNTDGATMARSIAFGKAVSLAVYNWAQTDNYLHASDPYTTPVGPGLWIPTPPANAAASTPYWGNLRLLVSSSGNNAQPAAPTPYSEIAGSPFFQMVKQVYDVSQTITPQQTEMALFWRDIPGVSTPGHYLSIVIQVLEAEHLTLDKAAATYALSSITVFDAAISTWKAKYTFNLVRPITYIRTVLNHPTWNSTLTTPAHPEYSSAHAVLSAANASVLESIFGNHYHFTDHTYDYLGMNARSFNSFKALGEDAGNSRLYAGIHYQPSIDSGLIQGRKIAQNVISALDFKRHGHDHDDDDDDN